MRGCARRLPVAYPYDLQVPLGVLGGSEVRGYSGGSTWMALPALALVGCGIGAMLLVRRRLT
jgi:hypothetical protein